MGKPRDIIGKQFGLLTVLSLSHSEPRKDRPSEHVWFWNCICSCDKATEIIADGGKLRGKEPSCGCLTFKKKSKAKTTHGMYHTSEYKSYRSMLQRCYNTNCKQHKYYKDIKVCDRWLGKMGFENFYEDMGPKPTNKHTLERIDNLLHYQPSNCSWIPKSEQSKNRRGVIKIKRNSQVKCAADWSIELGFQENYISKRLRKGHTLQQIFKSEEVSFYA